MSNKRILVIDDEDTIRRLLEATLVPEGFDVVLAHDGTEGLEKVKESSPDLILLDIKMPGLNGFEVLRILRERYDTPVIMLTAVREATSVLDAIGVGADWPAPIKDTTSYVRVKDSLASGAGGR